ncbi:MAG: hypothetical protein ACKO11_04440 [Cuspidothrix sp.]
MNDNIILIAAATGGFMISIALSGILKGAPIKDWQQVHKTSYPVSNVQFVTTD